MGLLGQCIQTLYLLAATSPQPPLQTYPQVQGAECEHTIPCPG